MPRGVPKAKLDAPKKQITEGEQKTAEEDRKMAEKRRQEIAEIKDKDFGGRPLTLEEMLEAERTITDNERINIIVEYACLGQEPKPEKYFGRPRYIKASRHGRTRLAKRSARRDDLPPPQEKMYIYDDEVARFLHAAKYASLRRPGTEESTCANSPLDESMHEEEHDAKEHSRDSGCPVSPTDKGERKDESGSSRGSVEKENRKRRTPDLHSDEANANYGTINFIVKGNTPLTVIQKLLERKRQITQDLRIEFVHASGKEILNDEEMNVTVADLANQRGWTRNKPLRMLYTITRFTESEDLPVLDVQGRCDVQPQPSPTAVTTPAVAPKKAPSPQQLQHMQHMHHMQQMQQQHQRIQQNQQQQYQMAIVVTEDGTQHMVPYSQLMMQQRDQQESLLKLSSPQAPPPSRCRISPQRHHSQQFMAPPPYMGGVLTPPQQQQQMTSSIFPPGHILVEHGNGSHLVAPNVSVESAISNPASVKKRQRMAPKRTRDRDELMARRGIEKGTTLVSKSSKMGLPMALGNLPGIVSIRMPPGCHPSMLDNLTDLPIEAIATDGSVHPTTLKDLPALAKSFSSRTASTSLPSPAPLPSSMLTPDERMAETISTVRSKAAVMHEQIQAERRASAASSSASSAGARTPAPPDDAAPVLAVQEVSVTEESHDMTPPPVLDAPDYSPDSPRSLEIDESMDESVPPPSPPPPPQPMHGIPV